MHNEHNDFFVSFVANNGKLQAFKASRIQLHFAILADLQLFLSFGSFSCELHHDIFSMESSLCYSKYGANRNPSNAQCLLYDWQWRDQGSAVRRWVICEGPLNFLYFHSIVNNGMYNCLWRILIIVHVSEGLQQYSLANNIANGTFLYSH